MTLDQGVSRMVARIIVPKEAATPHLNALRAVATRQAKNFGCRWSRVRRGDDIVFIFRGDKGDEAANLFAVACGQLGVPRRAKQPERLTGTQTGAAMSGLILKRASASRPSGRWRDDDYDVLEGGTVVGRIFLSPAAEARPWMWTLTYGYHEDRRPTHDYEPTREGAMAAFAKSWRRG